MKIFTFLEVKFSIYFNRPVFVSAILNEEDKNN